MLSLSQARGILQKFLDKLLYLPVDAWEAGITDPLSVDPPEPDVSKPVLWANVLWWPHAEFQKVQDAWRVLIAELKRLGKTVPPKGKAALANSNMLAMSPLIQDVLNATKTSSASSSQWLWLALGGLGLWWMSRNK